MDANGTGCGCDGTMRALHGTTAQQRSSQGRRPCTRLHIDITESTEGWSKTKLQPLWAFIHSIPLKSYVVPTPAFPRIMSG